MVKKGKSYQVTRNPMMGLI